ncbi:MAG: DeoR family transcriptional regulator [Nitrospirae bacterium]|nr:DeoR family transcriptional regulator [Nitrospirota bacterium]
MSKEKRMLSVKELAAELGVSVDTIRRAYWKLGKDISTSGLILRRFPRFLNRIEELDGVHGFY